MMDGGLRCANKMRETRMASGAVRQIADPDGLKEEGKRKGRGVGDHHETG